MTGALARMKTGLHLTQHLETRFGIMGPNFLDTVYTDDDLERHGEIIDKWHPGLPCTAFRRARTPSWKDDP
jgi:hypothetical protein